jgi:2-polyprenyl-3-methyl-5-hydroxy-6-metoxy-1,4-benzoquinol methylase
MIDQRTHPEPANRRFRGYHAAAVNRASTARIPGGNVYDKYGTTNPIERRLVNGFLRRLDRLVDRTEARTAHELGCGEGELALRLANRGLRVTGTDASAEVIAEARRRASARRGAVEFRAAPLETLDPARDSAELILCCEVLEHLDDPSRGLETIATLARPWAIVSVPREPLWRVLNLARLEYVSDLGNTPGHLHHWSRRAFIRFLESRLEVVEVQMPLPWTMALCRAPNWKAE